MKKLMYLALVSIACLAQATDYVAELDNSLASTARVLTLQMADPPTRNLFPVAAKVYCENVCVLTQTINGTTATATSATVRNPRGIRAADGTVWTQSNSTGGTVIATDIIPAGATVRFDLETYVLQTVGANLSLSTNAVSGRVIITIVWNERDR